MPHPGKGRYDLDHQDLHGVRIAAAGDEERTP
jgi:hypothetical protein